LSSIQELILIIPVLLLSLSFHEYAHGKVSNLLGDPTPKIMGRLTLNPLAHLDLMGSLVLIITRRIGWAKPVPINPSYYKNPRKGMLLVGIAGPGANIILAVFFALLIHLFFELTGFTLKNGYIYGYGEITGIIKTIISFLYLAILVNLSLAIFNLIPIPPLDGSKILRGFLPARYDRYFLKLEGPVGMILLLILAYTGILWKIISPVITVLLNILI
jgi:Zn-dependent protease